MKIFTVEVLITMILLESNLLIFLSNKNTVRAFAMPGRSFEFGGSSNGQQEKGLMELTF